MTLTFISCKMTKKSLMKTDDVEWQFGVKILQLNLVVYLSMGVDKAYVR